MFLQNGKQFSQRHLSLTLTAAKRTPISAKETLDESCLLLSYSAPSIKRGLRE